VLEVRAGVTLSLTISGGVAVSPEDGSTYDDLLGAADKRMYQDKERTKRQDDLQLPAGAQLPLAG